MDCLWLQPFPGNFRGNPWKGVLAGVLTGWLLTGTGGTTDVPAQSLSPVPGTPPPLERAVLSNRSLLGRGEPSIPQNPGRGRFEREGRASRHLLRFRRDRLWLPETSPPAVPQAPDTDTGSGSYPEQAATTWSSGPGTWTEAGQGTPGNPFRLLPPPRPVSTPVAMPSSMAWSTAQLSRARERQYWQQRAALIASQERVPPWLFLRLIRQESGFNPRARSPVGAIGLGQLMPETARALGVNPYDPDQNLRGGARYLRQMLFRFGGHIPSALAAYNAGPIAVEAYQRGETRRVGNKVINPRRQMLPIPPYRETRNYVASILGSGPVMPALPSATDFLPSSPPPPPPGTVAAGATEPAPALRRTGRIYLAGVVSEGLPEGSPAKVSPQTRPGGQETSPSDECSPSGEYSRPPRSAPGTSSSEMVRRLPNRSIYILHTGGRP